MSTDFFPSNWFAHSGDLGDIIYSLPTIRAAGGGDLYLYHTPGKTTHGLDEERVGLLRPLLILQPFIHDVIWCPEGHEDHNLNGFRHHYRPGRNLADMHLATHGLSSIERHQAWIEVDKKHEIEPVIFCRSARYQNSDFPWKRIWELYRNRAVFLGTHEEHQNFCKEVGSIPFYKTDNFLEAARILAASRLCVANQSALHAIAEGLKINIIMEVCTWQSNCCFERLGRINALDNNIELPESL